MNEPPAPTLTVAAVARRLGVAPATLRTWDRRYGLGPSGHTAGSHRRYTPADVARLVVMRRLTLDGVPPADAAGIARSTVTSAPAPSAGREAVPEQRMPASPPREELVPAEPEHAPRPPGQTWPFEPRWAWQAAAEPAAPPPRGPEAWSPSAPAGTGPPGGGRVMALPRGTPHTRGLARAAMSLDTQECRRLLITAMRDQGVVGAWQGLVLPVLQAIGERWQATGEGVDVEHLFSEVLMEVLRGVAVSLREPRNDRPVMLGCAEGDYHTLPLHALAAALAERGVGTRMLGVGMPAHDLINAVHRCGPAGVVLYAQLPVPDAAALTELRRLRPAPRVTVAGPGWQEVALPPLVNRAGTLAETVDEAIRSVHL